MQGVTDDGGEQSVVVGRDEPSNEVSLRNVVN